MSLFIQVHPVGNVHDSMHINVLQIMQICPPTVSDSGSRLIFPVFEVPHAGSDDYGDYSYLDIQETVGMVLALVKEAME